MPGIGSFLRKRPHQESAVTSKPTDEKRYVVAYDHIHHPQPPYHIDATFPQESYRSRSHEVKTAIHWGQRKLLLSEMQLLSHYARRGVSYHIVYAGSAPGTHLGFLDDLTHGVHTWELIDPGQFDRLVLGPRRNFTLRNEFFTNQTAYGINATRLEMLKGLQSVYRFVVMDMSESQSTSAALESLHESLQSKIGTLDVARSTTDIPSMYEPELVLPVGLSQLCSVAMERKPLLFVSDIRTGSVGLPNFEDHVAENMKAQQTWTEILRADYAMLKFRLPYTSMNTKSAHSAALIDEDGCVEYLDGEMVLPIWTRPTSTEGRLVVPRDARRKRYHVKTVEDQFFYFNAKIREVYHFSHLLFPLHKDLDAHFDAAAEVHALEEFVGAYWSGSELGPATLRAEVEKLVDLISRHLKLDFNGAIRRRDAMILAQKRTLRASTTGDDEDDSPHYATTSVTSRQAELEATRSIRQAEEERMRPLWWRPPTFVGSSPPEVDPMYWRGLRIQQ